MRSTATNNLSSFLLAVLLAVESYALLQQIPIVLAEGTATTAVDASSTSSLSFTTTNCDVSVKAPIVLPCPNPDLLKVSYVSGGAIDCGGALTLEQAAISPSIRADPSIVEPDGLYSLVLVDTSVTTNNSTNSFFAFDSVHPILHYGAVNIEGSVLLGGLSLDRTDKLDVFSPYQGPSKPEPNSMWATQGIETALFAYEYMLAAQPQANIKIAAPQLDSVQKFDYEAFFNETVGVEFSNLTSSTYFVSGWCVIEPSFAARQDPTEAPTRVRDPTEAPTIVVPSSGPTTTPPIVEAQSIDEIDETYKEQLSELFTEPQASTEASGGARTMSVAAIGTTTGLSFICSVVIRWLF